MVKEPSVYEEITRHVVRGSSLKCHTFSNPISPEKVSSDMDWSVSKKQYEISSNSMFRNDLTP